MAVGAARLEDLSPLGILTRGYAVCYAGDGSTVVKSIEQVSSGDAVIVRLRDGSIGAAVTGLTQLEER